MDSHSNPSPRLTPHSRVAVIGGGPAGSLFALYALQISSNMQIPLDITLYERKDLTAVGPRGCNMCAGILSHRVVQGLARLGIILPAELVMGTVKSYRLHWRNHSLAIRHPDPTRQVLSVYRAGGPRHSPFEPTPGLDEFLLRKAIERGAVVIHQRVEQVVFDPLPIVQTSAGSQPYDLVVLATGVNASPPMVQNREYMLPATETMAQDALLITSEHGRLQMDSTVHIYFDQPRDLIFGALVPKGNFVTISLLGKRLQRDSLQQLLAVPQVQEVVGGQPPQMCGCRPKVAVGTAKGFYSDRFVAVGDSCVTRLYKDGIGSALWTARAAAETALVKGIGVREFHQYYAPTCHAIEIDNRYGRILFSLVARSKRNAFFMRSLARTLRAEAFATPETRILSQTLWSLFTGDADYASILHMMVNPAGVARLCRAMSTELVQQ